MGRRLPWASSNGGVPATTRSFKRQKIKAEPILKPEADDDSFLITPQKPKRHNDRSPSTSPPPAPPDVIFMREGVDGDDVYMMVEDEFQTVAQSFTAHLHMAEYQRLKQAARERQRDRPVVPAKASFEVKYKHTQREFQERQTSTLKTMTSTQDEEREEEVVEPWAGTSLAGLMKWDGSQKTSLKGLDKLNSGSRAAQGLGPNSEKGTQSQGTQRVTKEEAKISKRVERVASSVKAGEEVKDHIKEKRDDTVVKEKGRPQQAQKVERQPMKSIIDTDARSSKNTSHQLKPKLRKGAGNSSKPSISTQKTSRSRLHQETKPRSFLDDLDDFDEAKFARAQSQGSEGYNVLEPEPCARSPSKPRVKSEITIATTESRTTKSRVSSTKPNPEKKERKSRYDEIPVFLY